MRTIFYWVLTIYFALGSSSIAHAKRQGRTGLNFGTNLRLLNVGDKRYAGSETNKDISTKTHNQNVSPFVGLVFTDFLSLGLSASFEEQNSNIVEINTETNQKNERREDTILKSVSLYTRFLFAGVMFLEGGLGVYDRRINVNNEYNSSAGDGVFEGSRESYVSRGVGPGYHIGGGVEIPVARGFYVSSSYSNRVIVLRQIRSSNIDFGRRRAKVQQREIAFGLSYYLQ